MNSFFNLFSFGQRSFEKESETENEKGNNVDSKQPPADDSIGIVTYDIM